MREIEKEREREREREKNKRKLRGKKSVINGVGKKKNWGKRKNGWRYMEKQNQYAGKRIIGRKKKNKIK